jgi:ionotropic glutamate receptor
VQQGSYLQDDLSRAILELQKSRYLEGLTAKYWNHSVRGDCSDTDEEEGITLESLGGVFIATLFGLALAMITLAGEVIYYKKKDEKKALQQVHPFKVPAMKNGQDDKPDKVMLGGDSFMPSLNRLPRLSYITMYGNEKFEK